MDLNWTCHVCGALRPDDRISVYKSAKAMGSGFVATQNVRYCNDRSACRAGAPFVDFTSARVDPGEGEGSHDTWFTLGVLAVAVLGVAVLVWLVAVWPS